MGKLNIVLDDDLEEEFRETIARRMGLKKGNISNAVKIAIRNWIDKPPRIRVQDE